MLPPQLRRVAVLPVACNESDPASVSGRDSLKTVVTIELSKVQKFEVVEVSPEALRFKSGAASWSCEETLPADLLDWTSKTYNCDAVLFCKLTVFRGYPPLAIGWRMRLVDTHTRSTLWAGDEVFDAGLPSVQAAARQYRSENRQNGPTLRDSWAMENSPTQFGQYSAAQLLGTLPGL